MEPVVRRRRRTPAPPTVRAPRGRVVLIGAVVALVGGLGLVWLGLATEPDMTPRAAPARDLVAATPVLSARRVPEQLVGPVAARNLRAAVQPVIDASPPDSCVTLRDGGSTVVEHRGDVPLLSASNMKLLTSAAALDLLDRESRLMTTVVTDGAPTDGAVVRGNLYLVGGGDPLLSTQAYIDQLPNGEPPFSDIGALADRIVGAGVREITGSVVGDERRYDSVRNVPAWPRRFIDPQGQVAPLSALLVDDAWRSGLGPADEPAVHAAEVLTDLLEDRGVEVGGAPASGTAPDGAAPLTELASLTVAELVAQALAFSDNTTTELLVKEIGLQVNGDGSTEAGLAAVRDWLADSGLPAEGVGFDDGSGLSENVRLRCDLLAGLLVEQGSSGVVADGLARPGRPGTLDDRLTGDLLRDRVRAKTGSLNPVTALSGWLTTVPGTELAFSYLINTPDRTIRESDLALQEQLLEAASGFPDAPPLDTLSPLPAVPPT